MSLDLKPIGSIDIDSNIVVNDNTIIVRGWCLINDKEPPLTGSIFINEQEIGQLEFNEPRPDVHSAFPEYKWGAQSGFNTVVNIEDGFCGQCKIGVKISNAHGESYFLDKQVTIIQRDDSLSLEKDALANIDNYPLQAYVEVTTACNLTCIMCRYDIKTKDVPTNLFFDYNLFLKLIPILPFLKVLSLGGWGEPTLHKHFIDFIRLIREANPNCLIIFTTNFNRISDELIEAFINYQVSSINISIDGASADVYEKIRKKGSYENLINNILKLNKRKQEKQVNAPSLSFEFVVQKDNVHELPDYIKLIHKLGGKSIVLEHVCGMAHLEIDYADNLSFFNKAADIAHELGIHIWGAAYEHFIRAKQLKDKEKLASVPCHSESVIESVSSNINHSALNIECYEPFQTIYINPDGRITPCCLSSRTMGNLNTESFEDIWFGEKYKRLRNEMVKHRYDSSCANCIALAKNIPKINM